MRSIYRTSLLLLIAAVLALSACSTGSSDRELVFTVFNGYPRQSIDPHFVTDAEGLRLYHALFEGLTVPDPQHSTALPGLAVRWESNEDATEHTFHLRRARFSDGSPITAAMVVKSWLRCLDPRSMAPNARHLTAVIEGAAGYNEGRTGSADIALEVPDNRTLRFRTVRPEPGIADILSHPAFAVLPMHVIGNSDYDWLDPQDFVGNGPFVLAQRTEDNRLDLLPNRRYHDRRSIQLDRLVFLHDRDNGSAFQLYLDGLVNWLPLNDAQSLAKARGRSDFHLNRLSGGDFLLFNTQDQVLADSLVRQALVLAIDRSDLVSALDGYPRLATDSLFTRPDGLHPEPQFDVARARELLSSAGFPDGRGFPEISLLYNDSPYQQQLASELASRWRILLNINVRPRKLEWRSYLSTLRVREFQLARSAWLADYPDPYRVLERFRSDSIHNNGQYQNPAFEQLMEASLTRQSSTARRGQLHKAEELLVRSDFALMPLYNFTAGHLIDTHLWGGWYPNPMDVHLPGRIYRKN